MRQYQELIINQASYSATLVALGEDTFGEEDNAPRVFGQVGITGSDADIARLKDDIRMNLGEPSFQPQADMEIYLMPSNKIYSPYADKKIAFFQPQDDEAKEIRNQGLLVCGLKVERFLPENWQKVAPDEYLTSRQIDVAADAYVAADGAAGGLSFEEWETHQRKIYSLQNSKPSADHESLGPEMQVTIRR